MIMEDMMLSTLATSMIFWLALISGLFMLYILPSIIAAVRGVEHLGVVIALNIFSLLWPGALISAFILPRKQQHPALTPFVTYGRAPY